MAVEVHHSYCHQCIAVCGLLVSVDGDHIVSVRGDPDHVVTRGYTCSKGRAHGALHHAPDRLDDPQLRHRGRLVPVSWDDLLDDLADHVSRLISDVGPDAVGTYFGSLSGWDPAGRAVAETFHRRVGSRSRYTSTPTDCPAKPLVAQAVLSHAAITPSPISRGPRCCSYVHEGDDTPPFHEILDRGLGGPQNVELEAGTAGQDGRLPQQPRA